MSDLSFVQQLILARSATTNGEGKIVSATAVEIVGDSMKSLSEGQLDSSKAYNDEILRLAKAATVTGLDPETIKLINESIESLTATRDKTAASFGTRLDHTANEKLR
jgi:hypothetical protein